MIHVIKEKITPQELKEVSEDLDQYIKFVVDIENRILAAGGKMHTDCERELLKTDSKQENLWGGGWDLETDELDFDSMINIRPNQGNSSREVLSEEIRAKMRKIADKLLR